MRQRVSFPDNDVVDCMAFNNDKEADIHENPPWPVVHADEELLSQVVIFLRNTCTVSIQLVVIARQKSIDHPPPPALEAAATLEPAPPVTEDLT